VLFAEDYARLLLVVHTIAAAALVAVCTHLVLWMRDVPRGRFLRIAAIRRFALLAAGLFTFTLVVGNLMYPVYKVRVRVEYFDQATAVTSDYQNRMAARERAAHRYVPAANDAMTVLDGDVQAGDVQAVELALRAAKIARWFDVKEHWVALGMAMSIGCAVLLWRCDPKQHVRPVATVAFAMAVAAAFAAWLGAILGVVASSYRAIGGP
jgi:hypothetical protein